MGVKAIHRESLLSFKIVYPVEEANACPQTRKYALYTSFPG